MATEQQLSPPGQRKSHILRNIFVLAAFVVGVLVFVPPLYDAWIEAKAVRLVAAQMLSAAKDAQSSIEENARRSSSLVGSGRGISIPATEPDHRRKLEWTISDDGHIIGRNMNASYRMTVEWIPSIQDSAINWTCKVVYPDRFSNLEAVSCRRG
jgi:hypothetical protein